MKYTKPKERLFLFTIVHLEFPIVSWITDIIHAIWEIWLLPYQFECFVEKMVKCQNLRYLDMLIDYWWWVITALMRTTYIKCVMLC